ncbi:RND transporter, partial [Pseudomonas sp. HMWF005]
MNFVESAGAIAGKPAPTGIVQAVQDPHFKQRSPWEQACQQLGLSVLLTVSLSACTVGPDFHKPEATQIADWAKPARSAPSQAVSEPLTERWWDVFHDAQLSALT